MAEEPRSADSQMDPAARGYPLWMLFGLGALCCAAWIGAGLLDLTAQGEFDLGALDALTRMPAWLLIVFRVMLVLAVPTLILCALRSPRLPARRHARAFYIVEALVMALVALPALLPVTTSDLLSLFLRLPTMSLGVAIAAVDPVVSEWWRAHRKHDVDQWWESKSPKATAAIVAAAGFCAVFLVAVFIGNSMAQCSFRGYACTDFMRTVNNIILGVYAFVCMLAALISAWLGYLLGARIAQSDRLRDELAA